MEQLIGAALSLILGEAACRLQPKLPWLDKLFQLNKIERENAEALQKINSILSAKEHQKVTERNAYVQDWLHKGQASASSEVRANERVISQVAIAVHALRESGVREVVLYGSKNDMAVIGEDAFKTSPEEMLISVVKMATSNSVVRRVEAEGYALHEVISEDRAKWRLAFILSLVETINGTWSGDVHAPPDSKSRKRQLQKIKFSIETWVSVSEQAHLFQNLERFSDVGAETISDAIDGRQNVKGQKPRHLNVFVVGVKGTGKSTTRWLLTGSGREDIGETASSVTRHVTFADDSDRIRVWDTPGLSEGFLADRKYKSKIKGKMMGVSHISAIMWQVTFPHRPPSSEEIKALDEYNVWFGGNLKRNLMVVFRTTPTNKHLREHIRFWESKLEATGVGKIGKENYICFKASTEEEEDKNILEYNRKEIKRATDLVKKKRLCVVEANKVAARAILECGAVKEGKRRDELKRLLESCSKEEVETFKVVLREAWEVEANYESGQLLVKTVKRYYTPTLLQILTLGLYTKKTETSFIIQTTCDETRKYIKEVSKKGKTRHGRNEYWVRKLCKSSFRLLTLTETSARQRRILHIFAGKVSTGKEAIQLVVKMLGPRKALKILESTEERGASYKMIESFVHSSCRRPTK